MAKQRGRHIGGFAAQNSGKIIDCYSIVGLKTKKDITGGFAGENFGVLSRDFYRGSVHSLNGGLVCINKGQTPQSYFFHDESRDSKHLTVLQDSGLGIQADMVRRSEDTEQFIEELGFDLKSVWQYIRGSSLLKFIPEKWLFDVTQSPLYARYLGGEVTVIRTADELFTFAHNINNGDKKLASAYIRLENDIDLGGREWEPIGHNLTSAFTGLFDGCGYKISNFKIKSKKVKAMGFFGYLKGEVYNLTVDCAVKGAGCTAGGIAAYCEGGVIGYCGAIVEIRCKNSDCGGLVGSNTGTIFRSYAAGKISNIVIPWLWFAPIPLLLAGILLIMTMPFGPLSVDTDLPIFKPVPTDPGIVRIPGEAASSKTGSNFVTFEFEREIDVNLSTGDCVFNFKNPGYSNHDIVIQLQLLDTDAVKAMGSTGRSSEEQKSLDENPQYDPANYRTVIAESGSVSVGYSLENLRLLSQPNGAKIKPGQYDAIVFLIFYDAKTHNRAMLESQFPVTINVH